MRLRATIIIELFASFEIRSEPTDVVRQRRRTSHCDEKDAGVVGLKNGEVKIQDSVFVKGIEEPIKT